MSSSIARRERRKNERKQYKLKKYPTLVLNEEIAKKYKFKTGDKVTINNGDTVFIISVEASNTP